jgi:hypothetical protein
MMQCNDDQLLGVATMVVQLILLAVLVPVLLLPLIIVLLLNGACPAATDGGIAPTATGTVAAERVWVLLVLLTFIVDLSLSEDIRPVLSACA